MPLTERDLEVVAIGEVTVGDVVISKMAGGEPRAWQVDATKFAYNERDGETVTLKPKHDPNATHPWSVTAPTDTPVHRVRRDYYRLRSPLPLHAIRPPNSVQSGLSHPQSPGPQKLSVPPTNMPTMAISRAGKKRWLDVLQDTRFILDTLRHQTVNAFRPNEFTRGTGPRLKQLAPGQLVRMMAAESRQTNPEVDASVAAAVDRVRDFLDRPAPWTTTVVAEDLTEIVPLLDLAIGQIERMRVSDQTVEYVVEELERDYLLSLAVTLSGQGTIAQKLAEWEQGKTKGEFLDIASFRLVSDAGPGRLHMRDVHEATDAGITTFLIGEGFRSRDKNPEVQYMLYSQWFTYMYALWEESYRVRLAVAHGSDVEGTPWTRFDIRSPLFGDIRNIRNDVVHKHGLVDASADNSVLTWFRDSQRVLISVEQMMSLVTTFPRNELLTPPARALPGNPQNLPWSVAPELVDEVRQLAAADGMTRKQKKDIGNEALRLWIAQHSD